MLNVKLGKTPKKEDKRTLKLANYLDKAKLPPIPPSFSWIDKGCIADWKMFANDRYGDCVWAAWAHLIMSITACSGNPIVPTDEDVLTAYASTGFDPSTGANDNGTNELDSCKYMQQTGMAGHKIGVYVEVNPKDQQEVMAAIYLFGGVLFGTSLPVCEQGQPKWSKPSPGGSCDATAGSWGGHGICGLAYSENGTTVITWGAPLEVDWDYCTGSDQNGTPYMEEMWAFVSPDWINGTQPAPNGFLLADLMADLQAIQSA